MYTEGEAEIEKQSRGNGICEQREVYLRLMDLEPMSNMLFMKTHWSLMIHGMAQSTITIAGTVLVLYKNSLVVDKANQVDQISSGRGTGLSRHIWSCRRQI